MTLKSIRQMQKLAHKVLKNAHSPYSKKQVACAVLASNGKIYTGCNVENASYGATICAERTAIVKAVSEGVQSIKGILVMFKGPEAWPPCGMCRQVMLEFADLDCPVAIMNHKGKGQTMTLGDLCPHSFSPKQMKS